MTTTKRHKVFISFQHGCEDDIKKCGKREAILGNKTYTTFNTCAGKCGRNCPPNSLNPVCQYYYKCGHYWKERFEYLFTDKFNGMISKGVGDGDIPTDIKTETTRQKIRDNFIADASVTVVLIGQETWKRKYIDWEISSSIINTKKNPRCGLLGILLPTYPDYNIVKNQYNPYTIPPRLQDNIDSGFASIHVWNENPQTVQNWIHDAFERRKTETIDNSYQMFAYNRPANQTQWQPVKK